MAERERMSAVDAAWLRMDQPTNLMMIVGVVILDEPLAFTRFRRAIADRFLQFERFYQRPVDDIVGAHWEADDEFDLDAHVLRVTLPPPAGKRQLETLVSDLAGMPLDPRRPLWQFHLVENYGAGAAMVMRIHHCYADGVALTRVFGALTDAVRSPRAPGAHAAAAPGHAGPFRGLHVSAVPGAALVHEALAGGAAWLTRAASLARHPQQAGELAQHAVAAALELLRLATLDDDPPTSLRGPLGRRKLAAWSEPLPLAEVRCIAHTLGCTVNDVLMTAAAGAVGDYLREHGEATDGLVLRATVPVNLRHTEEPPELGNRFGLVFLDLPVGIRDPLQRARAVGEAMARLKGSYQPALTLGLMAALGTLGEPAEKLVVNLLSAKASLVASNVPGPPAQLYLAGSRISQMMFWVPQSGGIGIGVSILSYDGKVQFGVIADGKRVRNPRAIARRFSGQFESLVLAVLLGPYLRLDPP